jgi:nicotinic acid mononucleotide adenylyltransferase
MEALETSVPGVKKGTILIDMKPVDIGSTDIRIRVAKGLSLSGLVPDQVERYIKEQRLYQ